MPRTPLDYLVESLLRVHSINIIGGAVGAGKSTVIWQLIEALGKGGKFFGYSCRKSRVAYLCLDRDREETMETLDRLQFLGLDSVDIFPVDELKSIHLEIPKIESLIKLYCPKYSLLVLEPLDYLLKDPSGRSGNPNDKMQVFQFLLRARAELRHHSSCILGSMHTTKSSPDKRYTIARERISGSAAWTANSSTSILVENSDPGDQTSPFRTLTFMLRNAPDMVIQARVDPGTGRLVEVAVPDEYLELWSEIRRAPPGFEFTTEWVKLQAERLDVHPRTLRRFMDARIEFGELLDGGYGRWVRAHVC